MKARLQQALMVAAVVLGSAGAGVFSATAYDVFHGANNFLIYWLLVAALIAAVGAVTLSFMSEGTSRSED